MRTFLGYVVAALAVAGLYWVVVFGPVYFNHLDAKDLANATFNQYRDLGVDGVRQNLIQRFREVKWATHEELDDEGKLVEKPGIELGEQNLTVEFDPQTKVLFVRIEYSRKIQLRPTEKIKVLKFIFERRETPPNVW